MKLEKLKAERENILKAELAAWLHDVGKLSTEFVTEHSVGKISGEKWHHELVLRRVLRKIKEAIGKDWQRITKSEVRQWMENEFSLAIPDEKRGRPFPNHNRSDFPSKLSTYLKRSPATGDDKTREQLIEIARQIVSEKRISPDFFAEGFYNFCEHAGISIGNESIYIVDIIEQHGDPVEAKSKLVCLFKPPGCDGIDSAMDKGRAESPQGEEIFIATAFGFEEFRLRHLNCLRKALSAKFDLSHENYPVRRKYFLEILRRVFSKALGETRRAANDVTLWDHSYSVGALYKSLAAWIMLDRDQVPEVTEFMQNGQWMGRLWRLFSIRTNGLEYLLSTPSIPDIKARQDLLRDAWNKVQHLLEEEYPLGLEVYRDENGSVFVVPDLDIFGLTHSTNNHKSLREYMLEAFQSGTVKDDPCLAISGEIVPVFCLDKNPWDGQSKLPPVGEHLKDTPISQSDPKWLTQQWCNLPKLRERCTVCGLRPQGPSQKAIERKVCDVCEKRREDRAKEWAANIGRAFISTIWIDEVADKNGRIALIVGKFDLQHWLDGTLVQTLAVRDPKKVSKTEEIAKNPSFARLRRIWETTKRFWEKVKNKILPHIISQRDKRIFIKGQLSRKLGPYHAYEIEIRGQRVAVLWDEDREGLWIIENPEYFKERFGIELKDELKNIRSLDIYEPSEYGKKRKSDIAMSNVEIEMPSESGYTPFIPILSEPQVFMAIVPANKAFEVVKAIKEKYEREMGKVRNRLPLHIGVVYAYRKMPLRAIMDAGRRMLKQKEGNIIWQVSDLSQKCIERGDDLPRRFKDDKNGQFKKWLEISIKTNNRTLTWHVPALMGNGETEDCWYPYVFLIQNDEPKNKTRYFNKGANPWNSDHSWLVHAGELEPGDKIYFTPATFDFEFLDSNARRFEIAYDEDGRRKDCLTKPYLLDEIPVLEKIWNFTISRLSSNQIFVIRDMIEAKRENWFEKPEESLYDEGFKEFCTDLFVNAEWQRRKPDKSELEWLTDMAVCGYFTDAIYLFHHVMKDRVEDHTETQ